MIYIYNLHLFIGGRHGEFVRFFKLFRKPKIVFIPECPDEVKLDNLGKELNTTQIHNKRGKLEFLCIFFINGGTFGGDRAIPLHADL